MNKRLKALTKKYYLFVDRQNPFRETDLYTDEYIRAKSLINVIPIIVFISALSISLNSIINNSFPLFDGIIAIFISSVLLLTPKLLKITRDVNATGLLIGISISIALAGLSYVHPKPFTGTLFYLPLVCIFTTLISGIKAGFIIGFITLVSSILVYFSRVNNHAEILKPLGEYPIITYAVDVPMITLFTLGLMYMFEKYRKEKLVEIKESNEKLTKLQMQQSQTATEKALGEMAGGIAHEINNPLFMITGSIEQTIKDPSFGSLTETNQNRLKKITLHAQKIQGLIDQLLNFSSSERSPEMETRVKSCIRQSMTLIPFDIRRSIDVQILGEDTNLKIDPFSMTKVFIQVLRNALLAAKDTDFPWVKIQISNDGFVAFIDIIDSGRGIDYEIAEKIFQPFFTTRDIGAGAGLGLSEARGLLQAFDGEIQYQ
ncbi:MAG: HAMP domain-containing sensor histidine kinase, partial [Bdellovibrionota bacterium]|nr:HAMP domain-containing sensor histidine kinase [Bdellovibrionota bacterium]